MTGRGLILAAPGSGSGKTTLTLGLLRAYRRRGMAVRGAKSGPDYIDPRFHEAASGATCPNLDAWAMGPDRITALAGGGGAGDDVASDGLLLIEGAMGLFDGAPPFGKGATADLARLLGLPVVLVVDASHMAQSVAPLVAGFAGHDQAVRVAGVILNKVGSPRHETMLRAALQPTGLPVLGALHRQAGLVQPARHLGLVQAGERDDLDGWLDRVAALAETAVDLDALAALAAPLPSAGTPVRLPPPGQRIAVAADRAFAFAYPHILADWRAAGADVLPFSPLADEAPATEADFIFLPGGYPELHAGKLAAAGTFRAGMRAATCPVYGECGGYMVLGDGLVDAESTRHEMLGLLRLETSFARRKLHLGYRQAEALRGPFPGSWMAHEFHYATTLRAAGDALFTAADAEGAALPDQGLVAGAISGSFLHLIDRAP
ncbi:MAG: cobyrinate a,c-diamide synthase [Maritimibacter sp.]|nr:cobyrinate a,c-diamide synthase [Maritimibacter sp.]